MPWLRDYADQAADPEYCRLTAYQRCIFQECRRLVQRRLSNIPNDPQFIGRAASLMPQDRVNVHSAIAQLIDRGFLTPTTSTNPFVEESRGEEKREREAERESAKSRRIPFSPDPPAGATARVKQDGKHVGWVIDGKDCLFEEVA